MKLLLTFAFLAALWCAGPPPAQAATARLTIYDDGLSCPAGCDAHVVFHPSMNGTEWAHQPKTPQTSGGPYERCVAGTPCRLCLVSGEQQCLEVMYRGGGPTVNTFDFTPRFFQAACATTPAQPELARKCQELAQAAAGLAGRKNCIAQPDTPGCQALIETALAAQKADRVEYGACQAQGQDAYNLTKAPAQQRSLQCAYERHGTGGPNSKGTTWRRLLPGACRDGTFVGRDGLDCCTGVTLADGPFALECRAFYPK
jgi:hypothetical protein